MLLVVDVCVVWWVCVIDVNIRFGFALLMCGFNIMIWDVVYLNKDLGFLDSDMGWGISR